MKPTYYPVSNQTHLINQQASNTTHSLFSPVRLSPQKSSNVRHHQQPIRYYQQPMIQQPQLIQQPIIQLPQRDEAREEIQKDMKIVIEHNNKLTLKIQEITNEYEELRFQMERQKAEYNSLYKEYTNINDNHQKELRFKQEEIKDLQIFIETNQIQQSRSGEELQQLKLQVSVRDQDILRLKQQIEEKILENQEMRNTLATINNKTSFITQQKDQQYQIIEQFNRELQDEISQKSQQILQLSQNLMSAQQQIQQLQAELNGIQSQVKSQQSQIPLQQLQQKFLLACLENERLHSVIESESQRTKSQFRENLSLKEELKTQEFDLQKLTAEFQRLHSTLQLEQKNQYLIEDLRKQIYSYAEENARLNALLYNR